MMNSYIKHWMFSVSAVMYKAPHNSMIQNPVSSVILQVQMKKLCFKVWIGPTSACPKYLAKICHTYLCIKKILLTEITL